ncbi:hypothetical protein MJO28_013044 [Puccinia striiformis f. sp. tritici]|nr:hypothetical protein Pst134EA_024488 [Puccinia striiformis f. sp. tritici]KAI9624137.1 hypothetical protein H4Q26_017000 [Puccinia striiformis f. sp. tritici PST-130]KNE98795.1 hypothetical protein PSTG_07983 [Puccinia striiformis f. sp. tritici PST-78]KAH9444903.1 hypothetical protein Pst134EB_025157 [Puccinia striiformis f. sp. tritici]KAH9453620.1 hypothetical protein Pst134EA_024488 [Puccinia striiformis f. sp. tritici]KAI7940759.1 hypothetical protein MJO28_013044 [Puccinia striiformis
MSNQTEQAKAQGVPNNQFHTLPIEDKKGSETTPALLTGNPGLKDGETVTTLPGPVIPGDQLAGQPVKSSDELDQRANALNNPKPTNP